MNDLPRRSARSVAAVAAIVALSGCATLVRASEAPGHTDTGGASSAPSVNLDGRWVAFASTAANIAGPDSNGVNDVFLRDQLNGTVALISRNAAGSGNGASDQPSVSEDGNRVAFRSAASDLVGGPGTGSTDVLVWDRTTGAISRACRATDGTPANGACREPRLSGDGRYVAFTSTADNLVAGDDNGVADVFVRDLTTGATTLVSAAPDGTPGNGASTTPAVNRDGHFVAFTSTANDLVPSDGNGGADVFRRDTLGAVTSRVSVTTAGTGVAAGSRNPAINAAGNLVAFESTADDIIEFDENGASDVFVRNFNTVTTSMVSVDARNDEVEGASERPSISADGRFVAFQAAGPLAGEDRNGLRDIYVRDRLRARTRRVSTTAGLQEVHGDSSRAALSGDGRSVAFVSAAADLVGNDGNQVDDVFVRAVSLPSVANIRANTLARGSSAQFTVNGTGFLPGSTVVIPTAGITVGPTNQVDDGTLIVTVTAANDAPLGLTLVWVVMPGTGPGPNGTSADACACLTIV